MNGTNCGHLVQYGGKHIRSVHDPRDIGPAVFFQNTGDQPAAEGRGASGETALCGDSGQRPGPGQGIQQEQADSNAPLCRGSEGGAAEGKGKEQGASTEDRKQPRSRAAAAETLKRGKNARVQGSSRRPEAADGQKSLPYPPGKAQTPDQQPQQPGKDQLQPEGPLGQKDQQEDMGQTAERQSLAPALFALPRGGENIAESASIPHK